MFGFGSGAADPAAGYYARGFGPILLLACLAATPLAKGLWEKLPKQVRALLLPILLLAGLALCTAYLVDATYNPFLYFRF